MKTRSWSALVLVLELAAGGTEVSAQPVYRCGNSYSQVPCAGAVVVDVDDQRTPQQKAQTDDAARQAAASAARMEKERLALERSRPGGAPKPAVRDHDHTPRKDTGAERKPDAKQKKKSAPEYFTAAARTDDKNSEPPAKKPASSPVQP